MTRDEIFKAIHDLFDGQIKETDRLVSLFRPNDVWEIEREFGIEFIVDEFVAAGTVGGLLDLIQEKMKVSKETPAEKPGTKNPPRLR